MSVRSAFSLGDLLQKDESKREIRQLWNTIDENYDGKISSEEWAQKISENEEMMSKYFGGSTVSEVKHAFNRVDSSGNNALTWGEFCSEAKSYNSTVKLAEAMKTEEGSAELKKLWDTLDKDGDKKISGKEWGSAVYKSQELMSKYFGGATLKEIGLTFNRIDTDKNGELTWVEFTQETKAYANLLSIYGAMETEEGKSQLKKLYDDLDKDGDGKVSSKEWGHAVYKNQDTMKTYFGGSTLEEIGETFNRIDIDGNNSLSWDEFIKSTTCAN